MSFGVNLTLNHLCRSPHGERGLKYHLNNVLVRRLCRSPHGERGLKFSVSVSSCISSSSRSPHGERGLKYTNAEFGSTAVKSLSSRRAWIEMAPVLYLLPLMKSRSPHGERGLKSKL